MKCQERLFDFLLAPSQNNDNSYYKDLASKNWTFWRPIMEKMSTFEEMSRMDEEDIAEFNAAIDIKIENVKRAREEAKNN